MWENITVEEILSDDSIEEPQVLPVRIPSQSCPTSPIMVRSVHNASVGGGAVGVSFSLPRGQGMDSNYYNLESVRNRRSADLGDIQHQRRNPFNVLLGDPSGDTAVRDYFTSQEEEASTAESANNVLLLKENYCEKEELVVGEDEVRQNDNSNNNVNKQLESNDSTDLEGQSQGQGAKSKSDNTKPKETVWRFLSVDDIYLSYWKISVSIIIAVQFTFGKLVIFNKEIRARRSKVRCRFRYKIESKINLGISGFRARRYKVRRRFRYKIESKIKYQWHIWNFPFGLGDVLCKNIKSTIM